jgi:hypothetical protein
MWNLLLKNLRQLFKKKRSPQKREFHTFCNWKKWVRFSLNTTTKEGVIKLSWQAANVRNMMQPSETNGVDFWYILSFLLFLKGGSPISSHSDLKEKGGVLILFCGPGEFSCGAQQHIWLIWVYDPWINIHAVMQYEKVKLKRAILTSYLFGCLHLSLDKRQRSFLATLQFLTLMRIEITRHAVVQ